MTRRGRSTFNLKLRDPPRETAKLAAAIAAQQELVELPATVAKEIEYVLDLRPKFFWVVGPGTVDPPAHVFRVTASEHSAHFEPAALLPKPPG